MFQKAEVQQNLLGEKVLKTGCYLCHGGCILLAHVKDGRLVQKEISYPHLLMGNILESNILDVWNNKRYTKLRRSLVTHSADRAYAPCNTCYYAYGWH